MKIEKYQNSLKGIYSITVTRWSTTIYVFLHWAANVLIQLVELLKSSSKGFYSFTSFILPTIRLLADEYYSTITCCVTVTFAVFISCYGSLHSGKARSWWEEVSEDEDAKVAGRGLRYLGEHGELP